MFSKEELMFPVAPYYKIKDYVTNVNVEHYVMLYSIYLLYYIFHLQSTGYYRSCVLWSLAEKNQYWWWKSTGMWQICVLSRQKICHNKLSFFLYKVHQQFWGGAPLHTAQDDTQKYVKKKTYIKNTKGMNI